MGPIEEQFRLTIIGCAAAWSRRPGEGSSCYLVQGAGTSVLLDLGQGSFSALNQHLDPADLHAVVVSHLHPDHGIDLVPLRHYLRYGRGEEQPGASGVALHAPADLRRRYDELIGEPDFLGVLPGPDLEPGERSIGRLALRIRPVTHAENSFGFRVALDGRVDPGVVYSGDCARAADLLPLLRPGDTLLSEASFGGESPAPGAGHINAREAGWAAREGRARRLILTHLLDSSDPEQALHAAAAEFDGEVLLARPGLQVPID